MTGNGAHEHCVAGIREQNPFLGHSQSAGVLGGKLAEGGENISVAIIAASGEDEAVVASLGADNSKHSLAAVLKFCLAQPLGVGSRERASGGVHISQPPGVEDLASAWRKGASAVSSALVRRRKGGTHFRRRPTHPVSELTPAMPSTPDMRREEEVCRWQNEADDSLIRSI
jgi:hypothetical protein